jgi:glycosyltransferase involved in cell wall biosynthesis
VPPSPSPDSIAIQTPYLLVIHIPIYVDADGRRWTDELWHKDLVRHLDYLTDFSVACPAIHAAPPAGCRSLDGLPMKFVELPSGGNLLRQIVQAPRVVRALWRAMANAEVVHSGVADWNITTAHLAFAVASLRRKYRLMIVESSTWRVLAGQKSSISRRALAAVFEQINRVNVSTADLAIFTQAEYRDSLLWGNKDRSHIIHASWIDADNVLQDEQATATWAAKRRQGTVRLLFAGRLDASKGVDLLLRALRVPSLRDHSFQLDIMGKGALEEACAKLASESAAWTASIRMQPSLPYGEPFFSALREYSAVVVPSVGAEQPRIVYDAYSQGVPILGCATAGLTDCVGNEKTGRLFPPNPEAMAEMLVWAAANFDELETMGMRGLERARSLTHDEMHRRRAKILASELKGASLKR